MLSIVRSLLFAPANRPDLVRKFANYQADAYIIDLEDGTPAPDKAAARAGLAAVVAALRADRLTGSLFVRTNDPASGHMDADLDAALATHIDGIMLPKLGAVADLRRVDAALTKGEARADRAFDLIGLIETAAGVMNVEALATCADSHLSALAFGAEDFITDLGGIRTADGLEVLYARSRVVLSARARGMQAFDQVFVNIRDDDGFRRDATVGRQLGYSGKMCVIPQQVHLANQIFSPSDAEIERSQRMIAAYQAAKAAGTGVIEFEGGMVDEPLVKRAEAIVALAERRLH